MNIHYLQHVPFEGLGSIKPWVLKQGYEITCSRLYLVNELPPVDRIDWLIIMGGPMSVNDELEYPWLDHNEITECPACGNKLNENDLESM